MFRSLVLAALLHLATSLTEDPMESPDVEAQLKRSENICISMMLLGCMGFMMSNFYLVNWPDRDIQRISWEVISSTVSIFSAVLLFQACNKVLEYYVLEGMWIWYQLVLDMVHMLLWFVALQLVLAYLSGAVGNHTEVSSRRSSKSMALRATSTEKLLRVKSADMHFEALRANTVCWATLLGHVTGFAAINAWGTLQQAVPRNLVCCTLVPVIALGGIFCIYQVTEKLRKMQTDQDGKQDEYEELWGEEVAETEDDVMSLAVSFLLVQALRFAISGYLPNTEGNDPEGLRQPNICSDLLLFSGFVFGGSDLVYISLRKVFGRKEGQEEIERGGSFNELDEEHRFYTWLRDIMAMGTAWCLHFSVDWWLSANIFADGAVLAVICAVAVTSFALGLIFVLDKLADMDFTDDDVDSSLRALIQSLGILIGFSWERSFDEAVGGLAEGRVFGLPPPVLTLLLAIVLASMVIPAWKWYILPVVLSHQAESRKHHEHRSEPGSPVKAQAHPGSGLQKPLLDSKEDARHEIRQDHSAPEITDVDADMRKKLEAAFKSIKDLEAKLAERDARAASEERRSQSARAQGAEQQAKVMQMEKELQEKELQLQRYATRLRAAEDAAKAAEGDLHEIRSQRGQDIELKQSKADIAELQKKQQLLEEALMQAKETAAEKDASSNKWKQAAQDEAGRRAALEERLMKRTSELAELQANRNAELDRMAAVATDTECRLRQAQASLAEQEQATSKTTADDLKEQLANAVEQVSETASRLAAAEKENKVLRAEVSRLRENKTTPSFVPMFGSRPPRANPSTTAGPSSEELRSPAPSQASPPAVKPAAFASPTLKTDVQRRKAAAPVESQRAAPAAARTTRVPPKAKAPQNLPASPPRKRSPLAKAPSS